MFETVEVGHVLEKQEYKRLVPDLRADLLEMQRRLGRSSISAVILLGGVEGAGRSETVNVLHKWMDARGLETHAMWGPSDEEQRHPPMWRYWRRLPPAGKIGVFFDSWYTPYLDLGRSNRMTSAEIEAGLARVKAFEQTLAAEGVVVLKFWLHLSRKAQRQRIEGLAADPDTAWRVTERERKCVKRYAAFCRVAKHVVRVTDSPEAPWHLVEAVDERYRHYTVARTVLDAISARLEAPSSPPPAAAPAQPLAPVVEPNLLSHLDLTKHLPKARYKHELHEYQHRLGLLTRRLRQSDRSLVVVLEGADASGKGGAIRRMTRAMDARDYRVVSIAAPTDEERAHPWLWRFWRGIPPRGSVTVYDRSWYGRVLVERVEGFATNDDWMRAYGEINDFEEQLTEAGIVLVKCWLQIGPDEQLRRFRERETVKHKQYKITEEDWRNREKSNAYTAAAVDMIERTSTEYAPWTLVEAEDKKYARLKVLRTVVERLSDAEL